MPEPIDISALLREHPVLDGHNDLLWAARTTVGYDFDRLDLRDSATCRGIGTHTDLPRLRDGGVGAQFWSVFVPSDLEPHAAVAATLEQIDAAYAMLERYAGELVLATTVEDVERAWEQGRIASLMGAEGGHQIDESLGTLRMLHRLGVRYLTLTHNDNNSWADSATDEPVLGGLSDFGRSVVAEMNRIGMLVDLSHVSAAVMHDALDASTQPVIFSHSSARALVDHPRYVPDDVLERLSSNGGLCMVTFVPDFVSADPTSASIEHVVAHVEHVRAVAGVQHVGLGGDYDGTDRLPAGLEDVSGYPRLLGALAERGWSRQDLAGLTCRNVLRVMGDAGLRDSRGHVPE